jgi:ribonuclease HI/catechol 2,3-dioxygenase-like lactoylglutathione lyase family enzyme
LSDGEVGMSDDRRTTVYTDGACLGNPGPGGWAWAVPGGRWRSGAEARSTNQRMEIQAALDAAIHVDGSLEVVSDSTYVVNCFNRGWWKKWVTNGWVNAARQPVANRDLWEPLVELHRAAPGRLQFRWVKGHSTDPFNDLVDRLAVAAASSQRGGEGDQPPGAGSVGPADVPTSRPLRQLPRPNGATRKGSNRGTATERVFPQLRQVVLDAEDARALADFYRDLLGFVYRPGDEPPAATGPSTGAGVPGDQDWLVIQDPNGSTRVAFEKVAELPQATWPEGPVPQQMHLDLSVATVKDLDAQHDLALSLGARLLEDRSNDPEEPLRVYADPAGHPFCIFVVGAPVA